MPEIKSGNLISNDGKNTIAWRQQVGMPHLPGIMFLHGFRSDMEGKKAEHLAHHCAKHGHTFTRFDFRGHGQSTGTYTDFTIGNWIEDTLLALDSLTTGPQILVGSSLGGWVALRVGELRVDKIRGLLGLAAAPDFPSELILPNLSDEQRKRYEEENIIIDEESEWPEKDRFSRAFIEESFGHNILTRPYNFSGPVFLIHGRKDISVPWELAQKLHGHIQAPVSTLTLLGGSDHRISGEDDLKRIARTLSNLIECTGCCG